MNMAFDDDLLAASGASSPDELLEWFINGAVDESTLTQLLRSSLFHKYFETADQRKRIAARMIAISTNEEFEDYDLIQCFATHGLLWYIDVDPVPQHLASFVKDTERSADVRHNALGALKANAERPEVLELLRGLRDVPEFTKSIERILRRHADSE